MYPRLSVNIVVWNSMGYLPELMKTISEQTFRDFSVLVIDNGSTDGADAFLREHYPEVTVIRNAKNLGFAPAHNQGIRYALDHWKGEDLSNKCILVTNPDTIWTQAYLERMMRAFNAQPDAGAFTGKLLRAFGENLQDEVFRETVCSDMIDSTGLVAYKNRTFADRGAGEMDEGQYDESGEVFGASGALALYRASALEDAREGDAFFDRDFFAYKEDVDLAWRLRQLGWEARFVPDALAYHYRGMPGKEKATLRERLRLRRTHSPKRLYYSTRNHWWTLAKNERAINGLLAMPRLCAREGGRFLYTLVFDAKNLKAYGHALAKLPLMRKKRVMHLRRAQRGAKEMRSWFV